MTQDVPSTRHQYRCLLLELALIAVALLGLAIAAASLAVRLELLPAVGMGLLATLCVGLLVRQWDSVLARAAWLRALGTPNESHR